MGETDTTSSLGEFGIAILLATLVKHVSRGNWTTATRTEVAGGVRIFVCYAIAYGISGGSSFASRFPRRGELVPRTMLIASRSRIRHIPTRLIPGPERLAISRKHVRRVRLPVLLFAGKERAR